MNPLIRSATNEDLESCLLLGGASTTDHVWQITQREQGGQIAVVLNEVRLPRPMGVDYPRGPEEIIETWKSIDILMVAEVDGQISGFVDLRAEPWHDMARIQNLIISEPHRRHGIGSALIAAANRWARERELTALAAETQAQNWPAISFYRKNGFVFCGFDDRYYISQIALFFTRQVK